MLLQPSSNPNGALKYDMRVLASNIEYFALMRDRVMADQPSIEDSISEDDSEVRLNGANYQQDLRDGLWVFDGVEMRVWSDVKDVIETSPVDLAREICPPTRISVDFYPMSIHIEKGVLVGIEPELVQRRNLNFAFFRFAIRV